MIDTKYLKNKEGRRKARSLKMFDWETKRIDKAARKIGSDRSEFMRSLALTEADKILGEDK
jgi:uncharacterized protein (DUF1778 family)